MSRFAPALLLAVVGVALASPVPKEKDEKLPPPTPEQWQKAQNNLKQIGLAVHNYHDTNGLAPANVTDGDGKPLLSWRVQLLPYVEEDALFREFRLTEAWDSDHNKKLLAKMPKVFAPARGKAKPGFTFTQGFEGPDASFRPKVQFRLTSITDGTSNTFLAVEAGAAVEWTKPADLPFELKKDLPKLGGEFDGAFNALMWDGSVYRVRKDVPADVLKAAITPQGGEVFDRNTLEEPGK